MLEFWSFVEFIVVFLELCVLFFVSDLIVIVVVVSETVMVYGYSYGGLDV